MTSLEYLFHTRDSVRISSNKVRSMPLVNFSNVDFDQIKESIKDYLRSNSNFTDYDFEGSNLTTIIDTLAYNTYINSYNANMVTNEVFIDSATLRENVVSLARNIGYVPRSRTSSVATVSFSVDVSIITAVTLTLGADAVSIKSFGKNTYILAFLTTSLFLLIQLDSAILQRN